MAEVHDTAKGGQVVDNKVEEDNGWGQVYADVDGHIPN